MVSFRKSLMVVALLALCTGLAMAQTPGCTATYTTTVLRSEGVTEPLSDINVTCTDVDPNSTGGAITGTYNITLISDAPITSTADAITLTGGESDVTGVITGLTTVTFSGVVLDGSWLLGPPQTDTYTFTVHGLRVNASTLPQASTAFTNGTGVAFLATAANKTSLGALFAGSPYYRIQTVAYAIKTLNFGVKYPGYTQTAQGNEVALSQCNPIAAPTADSMLEDVSPSFYLSFNEIYNAAFLTVDGEGMGATQGTRLSATFSGLPANTQLWVPSTIGTVETGLAAALVKGAKADGSGGTLSTTFSWVAVTAGTPVVYEIVGADLTATTLTVPVGVSYTGTPSLAPSTAGTVMGNYAPISSNPGASAATDSIPRFASAAQSQSGLYAVVACSTTLLFPYITTQPGWNVGIAVSNTGADPFGNAGQPGTCSFSFYGAGAPSAAVSFGAGMSADGTTGVPAFGDTTPIAPGTTSADVVSDVAGLGVFRGYAIAVCDFQYAHGYAFVIGVNSQSTFAHGYLALVIEGMDSNRLYRPGAPNGQYEKVTY